VRQQAELELPVVRHDEGLAGLRDEGLADFVLVLWVVVVVVVVVIWSFVDGGIAGVS